MGMRMDGDILHTRTHSSLLIVQYDRLEEKRSSASIDILLSTLFVTAIDWVRVRAK